MNFIVGKNGEINDIKIVKSINKDLDKEAIRVISLMPIKAWNE
ncbi:MAG: energy transducer TonB [Bacteroidetes bacterium]|nr:energy transducer TonB [Bacteroidota bacterium]